MAGKREGFQDEKGRGDLFLQVLRIIKDVNPDYVILENVKGILQKKHKWIVDQIILELKELGYNVECKLLNSHDFNNCQARQRVYIYGTKNGEIRDIDEFKKPLTKTLKDYLETGIDKDNYCSIDKLQKMVGNTDINEKINILRYTNYYYIPRSSDNKLVPGAYNRVWSNPKRIGTLSTSSKLKVDEYIIDLFNKSDTTKVLLTDLSIRSLTPRESYRLMGFKDSHFDKVKDLPKSHLYHTAGNSMDVGTIEAVIECFIDRRIERRNNEKR